MLNGFVGRVPDLARAAFVGDLDSDASLAITEVGGRIVRLQHIEVHQVPTIERIEEALCNGLQDVIGIRETGAGAGLYNRRQLVKAIRDVRGVVVSWQTHGVRCSNVNVPFRRKRRATEGYCTPK